MRGGKKKGAFDDAGGSIKKHLYGVEGEGKGGVKYASGSNKGLRKKKKKREAQEGMK